MKLYLVNNIKAQVFVLIKLSSVELDQYLEVRVLRKAS